MINEVIIVCLGIAVGGGVVGRDGVRRGDDVPHDANEHSEEASEVHLVHERLRGALAQSQHICLSSGLCRRDGEVLERALHEVMHDLKQQHEARLVGRGMDRLSQVHRLGDVVNMVEGSAIKELATPSLHHRPSKRTSNGIQGRRMAIPWPLEALREWPQGSWGASASQRCGGSRGA